MYLKTLKLRGFKSFAEPVELHFERGISVIVGPNGSGKSNVADGLQWAMASQPPSARRRRRMRPAACRPGPFWPT